MKNWENTLSVRPWSLERNQINFSFGAYGEEKEGRAVRFSGSRVQSSYKTAEKEGGGGFDKDFAPTHTTSLPSFP